MSKWEIDNSESGLLDRKRTGTFYIISDEKSCYPEPVTVAETMSESAARLIAAAPDLLEAAKYLLDHYVGDMSPKWKALEEAINKAEGNND